MADMISCTLDCFPENILVDILSYLNVRELVRNGRVSKRWRRLVKDQKLWRTVDLTTWKGVTSRVLWILLRQYLGCGLRCLRLRGLLLSARGGSFLSESWLQALASKCPRLHKLSLLHTDLRRLHSCSVLPPSLQVLELHGCELPGDFFSQSDSTAKPNQRTEGNRACQPSSNKTGRKQVSPTGVSIETLVLDNVPSFTDQHLRSLCSWQRLVHLELRDVIRVTAAGVRGCAPDEVGAQGLRQLRYLEVGNSGRLGSQMQMVSLGLGDGWLGLEELSLRGREVSPGLLCVSRLRDLRRLRLSNCWLTEMMVLRSCRTLKDLCRIQFCEVDFHTRHRTSERETGEDSEREREEAREIDRVDGRGDTEDCIGAKVDESDPVPSLRHSLMTLLPRCELVFTRCTITVCTD